MLAEGLSGRRGPSLLFLPFQQDSRQEPQLAFSPKAWLAALPKCLAAQWTRCLSVLTETVLRAEGTAGHCRGDHISSHLSRAEWAARGTEPGWHNSSGRCLPLGNHSREQPVFSSWESFLPETQYFFSAKICILTPFSLSLHLPEINNYFFPQWSTNILQNAY